MLIHGQATNFSDGAILLSMCKFYLNKTKLFQLQALWEITGIAIDKDTWSGTRPHRKRRGAKEIK